MIREKEEKKAQDTRSAESNLGIFDSIVAAFDDMKNGERIEDEAVWGGKDSQGRDARWKYDAQGKVLGQADKIKTGRKVRVGYLAKGQIQSLNNELQKFGRNIRISGITARQAFNPEFPDKEVSKPMLYVQGVKLDPASGKSIPFGEVMSMEKLYKMGLSNAQKVGGFYASTHSEDAIIDRLGDIFGVRKRKEQDPKYRENVAKAKLAEKKAENPNWLTFDERMQLQASQNQNRLTIAQLNAEQRQKAAEAARVLKELGYAINIDLAEAKSADASARSMANAKTGITNEAKYTPEQIEAEKKRAEEARERARGKVGSRQANPSSGDNRTMPTVAKDTNSITMPDGKVVKKNETYTDSRGRTMRWVGPGPKDWKVVK
jgi:YD repeat-containing protein